MEIHLTDNPLEIFARWFNAAKKLGTFDATAMALATANKAAQPSVRIVLLKGYDERGFVFYTNLESSKSHDLLENPQAALCFYWPTIDRQIRIEGKVVVVSAAEADQYYQTRPRESRIGAWASQQSRTLANPAVLKQRVDEFSTKFANHEIPRPEFWSGFRVIPTRIEFWQQGEFRLHQRISFRNRDSGEWQGEYLYP